MPIIDCTLIKGYGADTRRLLCERITDAACASIGASPEFVTVTVREVDADNYMRGRRSRVPAEAPETPGRIVRAFLAAMEARDLEAARGFLGNGFTMTFPGGDRFERLEDLVEWSKGRYRSVRKTIEDVDESYHGTGATVFCSGMLSGEWPDGSGFSGVRFADRFVLDSSRIVRQQVWNDLAEARPTAGK